LTREYSRRKPLAWSAARAALARKEGECRMDQVTARFAKASVMARAVVDRYKDET
jgi:hypothetical protein